MQNQILMVLSVATVGVWVVGGLILIQGMKSLRFLQNLPIYEHAESASISVIIPARNEERNLEQALQSVLDIDYPNLEVIVVNDRSEDKTGEILESLAQAHPQLRVCHISALPPGWLGKNYALQEGAKRARGKFLLFTDADIVFHPLTLQKAMGYVHHTQVDHLTIVPEDTMPGFFLRVVAATFGMFLFMVFQPWKAKNPYSRKFIGIGAFNLVRAESYWAVDGHQPIALRPDDDLKLGKLLKKNGFRQDILIGKGMIQVEWYRTVGELIEGLMKNSFAGVDYRVSLVFLGTAASILFNAWPWVAVFLTTGPIQSIYAVGVFLMWGIFGYTLTPYGLKPWQGVLFPIAVLLLVYVQWRATILTLYGGGITWRGTFYPLRQLKGNKV